MEQCLMYTLAFLAGGTTLLGGAVAVRELRRRVKLPALPQSRSLGRTSNLS